MYDELARKHEYYNNTFFGKWARLYDYEKYFLFPIRRKAAQFFRLRPPAKVIDVATGTGAQAYELAKLGLDVTGVDLSPEMLEQAKKKISKDLNLRFLHADATEIPFKDSEFDAASISLGLHDMPYEIGLDVLREIQRVVKAEGPILIVDYMEPKKHWVAKLLYPLIKSYETPNYGPFINRGLDEILKQVNLKIDRFTHVWGIAQIAVAMNSK